MTRKWHPMQLFRVVLCSFCVDAPWAHQNEMQIASTYILPLPHGMQVVKDYNTTDCILSAIVCKASVNCSCLYLEIPYPTQSL